jgi:cysteine-rich repeat protein
MCFALRMLHGAARLVVAILSISVPIAPAWAQPAVTFDSPHTSGCGPNNVEGWQFQTTASVTVSALGVYDSSNGPGPITVGDGLNFSIPVGLFDSECEQLAAVAIPAGTVATLINDYRYVGIAPIVLAAGQTYRVGAVMRCNDFTPQFQTPTGFALDPSLTAVETRRIAGGSSLACPTQTSTVLGFAPNFLIGPACGNGVVQDGEQCDDGNVADGDCCSSTCQYETIGSPCPADEHACTDDLCDAAGTCTHDPSPPGTLCRPAPAECDVPENCDGSSPSCPPDGFESNGTPCIDDGLFCSGTERCEDGSCTSGGNPCAVGVCDEDADQCVAPSPTATASVTSTASPAPTASVTATQASTPTGSPPSTPTRTQAATQTASPASTATRTRSATPTGSQAGTPTGTQISSPTRTAGPPMTATATSSALVTSTPSPTPTSTSGPVACVGDCDGSGDVTIGELITGVNLAIGTLSIDRCPAFDASGNGEVEINELIAAVSNALNGCP